MNEKSIAFITCVNDTVEYEEALYYIEQLNVPVGYTIDTVAVQGADCMAAGYQAAMPGRFYTQQKFLKKGNRNISGRQSNRLDWNGRKKRITRKIISCGGLGCRKYNF